MSEFPVDRPAFTADDIQRFLYNLAPSDSPASRQIMDDLKQHPEDGEAARLLKQETLRVLDRYEAVMDQIWNNAMAPDERIVKGRSNLRQRFQEGLEGGENS